MCAYLKIWSKLRNKTVDLSPAGRLSPGVTEVSNSMQFLEEIHECDRGIFDFASIVQVLDGCKVVELQKSLSI
jgi:hypothetical protein